MKLDNFFEKIFCINLDIRTDRWNYCKQEFLKYNLLSAVNRYSACVNPTSIIQGITSSHLNIIEYAKEQKLQNVFIFEDDVCFINYHYPLKSWLNPRRYTILNHRRYGKTFALNPEENKIIKKNKLTFFDPLEKISRALTQLQTVKWDMFFLGCQFNPKSQTTRIKNNLFQANLISRMHAYGVNHTAYDFILKNKPNSTIFDRHLKFVLSHKLKCIIIDPMVCIQGLDSDRKEIVKHTGWVDNALKTVYPNLNK